MAITNTITSAYLHPFYGTSGDKTRPYYEILQTAGSKTTQGVVGIFSSATASDDFILSTVDLSFIAPTASVEATLYVATTAVYTFPTMATGVTVSKHFNFGFGVVAGTTTTLTVSVVTSIGTSTVQFFAQGFRKV